MRSVPVEGIIAVAHQAADVVHIVRFEVGKRVGGLTVMLIDGIKTGDEADEIVPAAAERPDLSLLVPRAVTEYRADAAQVGFDLTLVVDRGAADPAGRIRVLHIVDHERDRAAHAFLLRDIFTGKTAFHLSVRNRFLPGGGFLPGFTRSG